MHENMALLLADTASLSVCRTRPDSWNQSPTYLNFSTFSSGCPEYVKKLLSRAWGGSAVKNVYFWFWDIDSKPPLVAVGFQPVKQSLKAVHCTRWKCQVVSLQQATDDAGGEFSSKLFVRVGTVVREQNFREVLDVQEE